MDRVPNARVKELCGVKKGLDERIEESVLRWFGHVERMERGMISKKRSRGKERNTNAKNILNFIYLQRFDLLRSFSS